MRGEWNGLPGEWLDDPTAVDGRRFVATIYSWGKIRNTVKDVCEWKCENCQGYTPNGDLHHVYGRGGGKRDDRPIVPVGQRLIRMILYLCRTCHGEAVIKPWGSWREDAA